MGFRDYLPIDGQEASNHFLSEVYPCFAGALRKGMEEEPLRGASTTHNTSSKHFPAFAIVDYIRKVRASNEDQFRLSNS